MGQTSLRHGLPSHHPPRKRMSPNEGKFLKRPGSYQRLKSVMRLACRYDFEYNLSGVRPWVQALSACATWGFLAKCVRMSRMSVESYPIEQPKRMLRLASFRLLTTSYW